jgi:hypothetical protein
LTSPQTDSPLSTAKVRIKSIICCILCHICLLTLRTVDPWRPATPHSDYAYDREDTVLRPFKIIPGAPVPKSLPRTASAV